MASLVAFLSQGRRDDAIGCDLEVRLARVRYIGNMMSLYEGQPFLSRLLLEAGRWFVFRAIVSLQAGFDERDRSSWPTLRLLQQELQDLGFASPRRTHDLVARLVHTGFVTTLPLACDGRVRLLAPTVRMMAHHRASVDALSAAIAVARPFSGGCPHDGTMADHGAVLRAARALTDNAPMLFFLQREVGMGVLMTLIRREADDDRRPPCFAEVGKLFGVSRTHVRLMLHDALRVGHLAGSVGDPSVTPATMAGFDSFLAREMALHTESAHLRPPVGVAAARYVVRQATAGQRVEARAATERSRDPHRDAIVRMSHDVSQASDGFASSDAPSTLPALKR